MGLFFRALRNLERPLLNFGRTEGSSKAVESRSLPAPPPPPPPPLCEKKGSMSMHGGKGRYTTRTLGVVSRKDELSLFLEIGTGAPERLALIIYHDQA
jgi:hypothetical protein